MFYLRIDEKTLIRRVLQSRGMDYWESGMDMKLGDDIYESFRAYQRALLKEYGSMAEEFGFRILDARRKVDVIQDELRRQIAAFLAESDTLAPGPLASLVNSGGVGPLRTRPFTQSLRTRNGTETQPVA